MEDGPVPAGLLGGSTVQTGAGTACPRKGGDSQMLWGQAVLTPFACQDGLAAVAAIHDVINRPGISDAELSGHAGSIDQSADLSIIMRLCGTDPFTIRK